jgi:hypothetical protein
MQVEVFRNRKWMFVYPDYSIENFIAARALQVLREHFDLFGIEDILHGAIGHECGHLDRTALHFDISRYRPWPHETVVIKTSIATSYA